MAESKRATESTEQHSIPSLDNKTREWLDKILPLLDGRGNSGSSPGKPGVLAYQDLPPPAGLPTTAPSSMIDDLTAAIRAKDAHKVSQYISLFIVSGHHWASPDSKGEYPLILAVMTNDYIIASLLVQSFTNVRNAAGETPLILAAQLGNVKIVEMLLKNRAEVRFTDNKSKTALDYALEKQKADPANKGRQKVLMLLHTELERRSEPQPKPKTAPKNQPAKQKTKK
jgi:ankyrin repeat protein